MLPLWVDGKISKNKISPDGGEYIKEFFKQGFDIARISVLGQMKLPFPLHVKAPQPLFIKESMKIHGKDLCNNEVASVIRQHWKWI